MPLSATLQLSVRFTGPGNTPNQASMSASATYEASAAGFIDIADTTPTATVYVVPYGTVANPKAIVLQNNTGQSLDVSIDAGPPLFRLPDGAVSAPFFSSFGQTFGALKVTTTATQVGAGRVSYIVLGD